MKKLIVLLFILLFAVSGYSANLQTPNSGGGTVRGGVQSSSYFLLEVSKGNIPGHSIVNKFGHNPTSASGVVEDVWGGGGIYSFYPLTAQFIDLVSDHDNDTSTLSGAREVTVMGLCEDSVDSTIWIACEETKTMTGQVNVELTNKYVRLFRAFVRIAGHSETNVGNITAFIRGAETLANTGIYITAEHGQTQQASYTVPSGKTGYFLKGYVGLVTSVFTTTQKSGTFNWMLRVNAFGPGGAWLYQGEVGLTSLGSNYWIYEYGVPAGPLPGKTDIRIVLSSSNDAFDTIAGYDLVLVDDGY